MSPKDNHARAKRMVDSWPSWKKEVSLTKYSTQASSNNGQDVNTDSRKAKNVVQKVTA